MRAARLLTMFVCALAVQTGVASAHYDWLDKLSGPGPFHGIDIQYRFLCVSRLPETVRVADNDSRFRRVRMGFLDQGAGVVPIVAPRDRPDVARIDASRTIAMEQLRAQYAEADCERDTNVRGYLAVKWGPYKSSENVLFPADADAELYQVRVVQTALKAGYRAWRGVDAVGAVGVNRFTGAAFETFWRPSVMLGVAIYPAAFVVDSQLARTFMFEFGAHSFLKGFDAADFCQPDRIPGIGCRGVQRDFDVGVEVNPHIGVTVDLVFFKWLLGGRID